MNTVKEALEAAKKHLWDGNSRYGADDESEYICYAAQHAIRVATGQSVRDVGMWGGLWNRVESYVESKLEGCATAESLAYRRGVERGDYPGVQAFRLTFIDELIAGLE